jgi:hypothetical protein
MDDTFNPMFSDRLETFEGNGHVEIDDRDATEVHLRNSGSRVTRCRVRTTLSPAARKARAVCRPIKPIPPVIRTISFSFHATDDTQELWRSDSAMHSCTVMPIAFSERRGSPRKARGLTIRAHARGPVIQHRLGAVCPMTTWANAPAAPAIGTIAVWTWSCGRCRCSLDAPSRALDTE